MAKVGRQKIGKEVKVEKDTLTQGNEGLEQLSRLFKLEKNEEMCSFIFRLVK